MIFLSHTCLFSFIYSFFSPFPLQPAVLYFCYRTLRFHPYTFLSLCPSLTPCYFSVIIVTCLSPVHSFPCAVGGCVPFSVILRRFSAICILFLLRRWPCEGGRHALGYTDARRGKSGIKAMASGTHYLESVPCLASQDKRERTHA